GKTWTEREYFQHSLLDSTAKLRLGIVAVNGTDQEFTPAFEKFMLMTPGLRYDLLYPELWKIPPAAAWMPDWGAFINPAGDCQTTRRDGGVPLPVPGTPVAHWLQPPNTTSAPRLMQEVSGDVAVQVKVLPFPRPRAGTPTQGDANAVGAGLLIWRDSNQ